MVGVVLWPLLLPLAACTGWFAARKNNVNHHQVQTARLSREYYVGLNYLLNEQPDKAVDVFIKLLEVDGDTVETHLALGSLFRRRGEVDRAIRVHQNLIARSELSREQRAEALLALGRDYMSAGVLDRAERIFREIVTLGDEQTSAGLAYLLDIYQQEKAWDQAMQVAATLQTSMHKSMQNTISHHYCEMAETALKEMNIEEARRQLKKAILTDPRCVRASLLQARIEVNQGHLSIAIDLYKCIKDQDPRFLLEALPPMMNCYEKLGDVEGMMSFLWETLHQHPRMTLILTLADRLLKYESKDDAIQFLGEQLRAHPSLLGLCKLTEWQLEQSEGDARHCFELLSDIMKELTEDNPIYRCDHCGFSGKTLHWQCPGCKHWSTISPIRM